MRRTAIALVAVLACAGCAGDEGCACPRQIEQVIASATPSPTPAVPLVQVPVLLDDPPAKAVSVPWSAVDPQPGDAFVTVTWAEPTQDCGRVAAAHVFTNRAQVKITLVEGSAEPGSGCPSTTRTRLAKIDLPAPLGDRFLIRPGYRD